MRRNRTRMMYIHSESVSWHCVRSTTMSPDVLVVEDVVMASADVLQSAMTSVLRSREVAPARPTTSRQRHTPTRHTV